MLIQARMGETLTVKAVEGKDKSRKFLFSLGCFEGERITLISELAGMYIVGIKDGRYALDAQLAKTIIV